MKIAVLFDIDGTLVDLSLDFSEMKGALLKAMSGLGLDISDLSPSSPTQDIIDHLKMQTSGGPDFEYFRSELYRILDSYEEKSSRESRPLADAANTLEYLARHGVRLGVVTNSGRKSADEVLKRTGLISFFEFVLTRDDVEEMKPRGSGLLKALSLLQMKSEQVYYVGDSIYDIRAAKEAGVRTISIATGIHPEARLAEEGAYRVIRSLSELPSLLGL